MLTYILLLTAMEGCQTGVVCLVLCGHRPQSEQTGKCRQNIFPARNADSTCNTPHVPKLVAHDKFSKFCYLCFCTVVHTVFRLRFVH